MSLIDRLGQARRNVVEELRQDICTILCHTTSDLLGDIPPILLSFVPITSAFDCYLCTFPGSLCVTEPPKHGQLQQHFLHLLYVNSLLPQGPKILGFCPARNFRLKTQPSKPNSKPSDTLIPLTPLTSSNKRQGDCWFHQNCSQCS